MYNINNWYMYWYTTFFSILTHLYQFDYQMGLLSKPDAATPDVRGYELVRIRAAHVHLNKGNAMLSHMLSPTCVEHPGPATDLASAVCHG